MNFSKTMLLVITNIVIKIDLSFPLYLSPFYDLALSISLSMLGSQRLSVRLMSGKINNRTVNFIDGKLVPLIIIVSRFALGQILRSSCVPRCQGSQLIKPNYSSTKVDLYLILRACTSHLLPYLCAVSFLGISRISPSI
jgi:hypothetical protein